MKNKSKSHKTKNWETVYSEVLNITDSLGMRVDENIRETVTALKLFGFITSGSCEGHASRRDKLPYPWVDIESTEPKGWQKSQKVLERWKMRNLRQQARIIQLLEHFYSKRKTSFNQQLGLYHIGAFGAFRIQSNGAETLRLFSPEDRIVKYRLYKEEMNDFTAFLRRLSLKNEEYH